MSVSAIRSILLHLRLPYNFLLLSSGFLIGLVFAPTVDWFNASSSFCMAVILLMGGINLLNSYYDKDVGPIGGLSHPPPLPKQALPIAVLLQLIACLYFFLFIAASTGIISVVAIVLSFAYSHPHFRWKSHAFVSMGTVGIGNFLLVLLGFYSGGGSVVTLPLLLMACAFGCMTMAYYPVSQLYQTKQDAAKKDITFAILYKKKGVKILFLVGFYISLGMLWASLQSINSFISIISFVGGGLIGMVSYLAIETVKGTIKDYRSVMNIKILGGMSFLLLTLTLLGGKIIHLL